MPILAGMLAPLFALAVAAAGWYYMFYSRAAAGLRGVEEQPVNQRRIRLRRINGLLMFLLGVAFFALFTLDQRRPTAAFLAMLLTVLFLLVGILALALLDLRLTWRLRQRRRR